MNTSFKTAEFVSPQHPDKLCDRIADALLDEILAGPVAYVFYETEPVEAAKTLKDFSAKSKGVLEIKGGISDGKAVSADDVKAIAELPTKDQLLGQIAGLISGFARDIAVCVNGVSSGLARSIQQVSEQKAA